MTQLKNYRNGLKMNVIASVIDSRYWDDVSGIDSNYFERSNSVI